MCFDAVQACRYNQDLCNLNSDVKSRKLIRRNELVYFNDAVHFKSAGNERKFCE